MNVGPLAPLAQLLAKLTDSFHSSARESDVLTHHHAYTIVKLPQCMHNIASFQVPPSSSVAECTGNLGRRVGDWAVM